MKKTFMYVIGREDGPVKVGISSNPWGRLKQLQTGCPFKAELLHVQTMRSRDHALSHERQFHQVHEDCQLDGEWFNLEADLAVESIETSLSIEEYFERQQAVDGKNTHH